MSDLNIVVDSSIEAGVWPAAFAGAWIEVSPDPVSEDTVASLFFDSRNTEGTVIELAERSFTEPLPQAYVSWTKDGACRELYVEEEYRRRAIGSTLCAWARSYCLKYDVIFSPPIKMSPDAILMFQSLCNTYGEEYTDPQEAPVFRGYGYWGVLR
jgi:GNAT superfamily N-acetyltransferase